MIVTIPATQEHAGISLVTLEISDNCQKCGAKRGKPFGVHSYDGSRRLNCDGWDNPCGHVDTYEAIRAEGVVVAPQQPRTFGEQLTPKSARLPVGY